jgi:hypothetical protein
VSGDGTAAAPDDLRRRLGEAATLVAAGAEALDRGRLPQLEPLAPLIDGLTRELARLPGERGRALRPALLALLDEIARLTERLAAERARLGERLRGTGAHRRADAAYRRTGGGQP